MEPHDSPGDASCCPNVQTLADFYSGLLGDEGLEAVAAHLSACTCCQSILADLERRADRGGLSDKLRRCLVATPVADDPEYRRMEDAARALQPRDTASVPTGSSETALAIELDTPADMTVGPYEVRSVLGRGGMGVVYSARHRTLHRPAALKMVRAGVHAGPEALLRFRTEAEAVARLRHPHIVQIYDYGEHDGLPYFAMELVEGGTLATLLAATGPLPFDAAAQTVGTLAVAIGYAHRRGVLHRDLKPVNVLMTSDGLPKVSDFGLARLTDADPRTTSDVILGTPAYMAPEQATGRVNDVGPAADVYGLGAVLYECLTGTPPFAGKNKYETLRLVAEADVVAPRQRRPDVPPELEAVCLKCLEKRADRRYPSADELAADLRRWLTARRTTARPAGWVGRNRREVRRTAVVCAALLTGGGLAAALYPAWEFRGPDVKAEAAATLTRLTSEIAAGRTVNLIRDDGLPKWSRWVLGETTGNSGTSDDGTFTVQSWNRGLVELLPDPHVDRYQLTAQVLHARSDRSGEVGVYVGRDAYPGGGGDIHLLTHLTYNDVNQPREPMIVVKPLADGKTIQRRTSPDVRPQLRSHLMSEPGRPPDVDSQMHGPAGQPFQPAGENGRWRSLKLTVGPNEVTAEWEDQPPLKLAIDRIDDQVAATAAHLRTLPGFDRNPFVLNLRPRFARRGGLGLLVGRGAASFRGVSVTPLAPVEGRRDPS